MGGLIGFILGYYLGTKAGPERLDELRSAAEEVLRSSDFQALVSSAQAIVQSTVQRFAGAESGGTGAAAASDRPDLAAAVRIILESEDFKALLSTGASLLDGFVGRGRDALFGANGAASRARADA